MIRLLIADDSALMRKLLEGIFLAEGDFDIRLARNGAEALELVRSFDPQVVTLDVQMPGMDGRRCLGQIMIEAPRPVVMISALTAAGAEATLEAIALGAIDFVAKPAEPFPGNRPSPSDPGREGAMCSQRRIRRTLRLKERIRHQLQGAGAAATRGAATHLSRSERRPIYGVDLIGTRPEVRLRSTSCSRKSRPDFPGRSWSLSTCRRASPVRSPNGSIGSANCGSLRCTVRCRCRTGAIYVGRGDADLIVAPRSTGMIAMSVPSQRDYPWHPSVERMVTSALEHFNATRLIRVLMTGMGRDGADAMTRLHEQGGRTIAEAESTAVVWGMPGELVRNGGAEFVRPVEDIAGAIVELVTPDAPR